MKTTNVSLKYLHEHHWYLPAHDEEFEKVVEKVKSTDTEQLKTRVPELQEICDHGQVIDVGAYVGDTARTFMDLGASSVFAFEPFFDSWTCLCLNCPELNVVKIATPVGDGRPVTLVSDGVTPGMRHVTVGEGEKTIRIDELNLIPDLIKIDVEGFEPAVLGGALKTLLKWKPALLIEVFPSALARYGWTPDNIHNFLHDAGYNWRVIGEKNEVRWDYFCEQPQI